MSEIQPGDLIKVWIDDTFGFWKGKERPVGPDEWDATLGIVLAVRELTEEEVELISSKTIKRFKVFHPYSPARAHVVWWSERDIKKVN